jgi:hypothetical protein
VRLILLTFAIVGSYLAARLLLTPASFGEYGWFRGAALGEIASHEQSFAGMKACEECHSEIVETLTAHEHKTLSCETCHGVGKAHADDPDVALKKLSKDFCLRCHLANPSRPAWMKQLDPSDHYEDDGGCVACHLPHHPTEAP